METKERQNYLKQQEFIEQLESNTDLDKSNVVCIPPFRLMATVQLKRYYRYLLSEQQKNYSYLTQLELNGELNDNEVEYLANEYHKELDEIMSESKVILSEIEQRKKRGV